MKSWCWAFILAAASACGGGWTESSTEGLRVLEGSHRMSAVGKRTVKIPVESSDTSFLLTMSSSSAQTWVAAVRDPDGKEVFTASDWTGSLRHTGAVFTYAVQRFNWPIADFDAELTAGTWQVDMASSTARAEFDSHVLLKSDDNLAAGTLQVSVFLADTVANDANFDLDTLEAALDEWVAIYADIGITVELIGTFAFDPGGALEPPGCPFTDELTCSSADVYEALSANDPLRSVNVVVLSDFDSTTPDDTLGFAGGIPGPLIATDRSAVAISWLESVGVDGVLSGGEVSLLGETMAHETGHFLGLFHPVETNWNAWDSLSDTAQCTSASACANQLSANLMFPTPVCADGTLVCDVDGLARQTELTSGQGGVMHRYTGVD